MCMHSCDINKATANSFAFLQFGDSLLAKDGVLVRLCMDESQDTDVLCSAVQCVANISMRYLILISFFLFTVDIHIHS